ncbi:S41 family peptidase [Sulfurospirillum multivorans]|uniref:Carboxy-terminal processing protease n=2 Tax=Sulfurospirillum multivorans TaxID=66821 RepID=A0AA86DYZ8_SULMK|nr:S41 family peptidase [Sulfurospirillum multivorans]AHJ11940.1 carboxy-terminal processing protease [Sulfurospirillum multivorans DSM 12446]QEH05445.1 carboxy-terminal processing protease [Sulfurospirillum multivorans]
MRRFFCFLSLMMTLLNATPPTDSYLLYQEVVQKIKEESVQPFDEKRLMEGCLEGMVTSVDINGRYLNEEEYETLYLSSKPVAGVGLYLIQKRNHIYVKSVVDHSPAHKANLQKGDEIVQIDGVLVRNLSLDEVISALRGSPNTKIKLLTLKLNSSKPIELQLTRKAVTIDLISSLMFENDIAYVKISSFAQDTLPSFLEDMRYLYEAQKHKINGMILDLRDNPGGIFSSGIAVTSLFLEKDKLVLTVKSRHKEEKKQYKNTPQDFEGVEYADKIEALSFLKTVPLVILTNNDSAGSSEIVSSVLQEYNRAMIIGTPTFGKDTFATLFPLSSNTTAVKFATARWCTPKGKSVWPSGVIPNIEINQGSEEEDIPLQEALRFLQKK